ncbi:MAG: hypothetical protein K6D02_10045 [Lachnospiraceae bacterium]|nr:hypothetical protein [Lachnospiraceae bacterium]
MINGESIIIKGCELSIGEKYNLIFNRLKNQIHTSSDLNKDGNAFITIEEIDLFEIKGEATLFFHNGVLDNIVLLPEWNKYNLIKQNGERMRIDEATYLVYKKCHDFLVKHFGPKVNDEYIPETYAISQHYFAALYMSPDRDSVRLVLRSEL